MSKLRQLREKRGLTQRQVAEAVGVLPQQISNIERGADRPSLDTALALAKLFRVDVSDLFDTDRPMAATP